MQQKLEMVSFGQLKISFVYFWHLKTSGKNFFKHKKCVNVPLKILKLSSHLPSKKIQIAHKIAFLNNEFWKYVF